MKEQIAPYNNQVQSTGIIAPYNNQVQSLKEQIDGIEQATVHKFQGKEKDTIIISTVEDEITDFYRKSKRNKKKMMRKIHKTYDHVCDCLEHD